MDENFIFRGPTDTEKKQIYAELREATGVRSLHHHCAVCMILHTIDEGVAHRISELRGEHLQTMKTMLCMNPAAESVYKLDMITGYSLKELHSDLEGMMLYHGGIGLFDELDNDVDHALEGKLSN